MFSSGSNVAVKGGVYNSNIVIDGGQMVSIDNAVYENTYDDRGINEGWRPNSKIEVSNASALNLNKAVFKGNTLVGTAVPTSGTGVWGMVQGRDSAVDISNSSFVGNRAITIPADPTATYGVANSQGGAVYFNGGSGVIRSTVFENNSALSANSQGGALAIFSGDYRFDSVKFSGNYSGLNEGSVSKSLMSGGALYIGETGGNAAKISISNSSFAGNAAEGAQVRGGAIVYSAENADSYLKIDNSSFTGNRADGVTMARGGAVRLYGGNAPSKVENNVFTDVGFTENVASASNATSATVGGGAVFLDGAVLTFKATKDMTYSGNAAVINGVNDDRYGGFLMMNKNVDTNPPAENYARAIFDTDRGATLTIGTAGRTGYDSIASVDGTSIVEKRGEGKLIVNSSMEHFKGSLIVGGGEMTANNRLGASSISIASGAALGVKVFGNAALSSSSLAFDNSGTFKLVAAEGLAAGSYGVSADSGFASGDKYINGTVKTFGGTFDAAANSFIVAEAKKITIDDPIQPKTSVEENGRVEISTSSVADAPAVVMNFSSNNEYAINSVTDVAADEKFVEAVSSLEEGALMAGAYDFNLETELAEGDSVSLSFYIGAGSFDLGSFKLFHQNDDGTWTLMENVEGVTYDGNYLSFEVAHFSSYGFALVPEPAAFAALAGLVILVFSARRRRV